MHNTYSIYTSLYNLRQAHKKNAKINDGSKEHQYCAHDMQGQMSIYGVKAYTLE